MNQSFLIHNPLYTVPVNQVSLYSNLYPFEHKLIALFFPRTISLQKSGPRV